MKIFYAQSGGVTSVINTTLSSLVLEARQHHMTVMLGLNGIKGLFCRQWVDSATLSPDDLNRIAKTPGGSFGSCRYSLSDAQAQEAVEILEREGFNAIVYQGGNDSQLTLLKISQAAARKNIPLICLGIPKTIDNDLPVTDFCPGFLSSAEFLIRGFRNACLDIQSMCADSTKVFIVETMGRHTGWLTASCGLSHSDDFPGPQILLVPESPLDISVIDKAILQSVNDYGFCAIAISEGYAPQQTQEIDSFGHAQLEGSGAQLKHHIQTTLKLKTRLCLPDYFQRSFVGTSNPLDIEISAALGQHAIHSLKKGTTHGMLCIAYDFDEQRYRISQCSLDQVAGKERPLPAHFLDRCGYQLSPEGLHYFKSLCQGLFDDRILPGLHHLWPHYLHQMKRANR